jgi:hypothetical protein
MTRPWSAFKNPATFDWDQVLHVCSIFEHQLHMLLRHVHQAYEQVKKHNNDSDGRSAEVFSVCDSVGESILIF